MTITIENRPINQGVYTQHTTLQGSNITLQQAHDIVKNIGAANAISQDGRGLIGLWRMKRPDRPDLLQYNTQPPRPEIFDALETTFVEGAALAFIPTAAPYVTDIYNSFVLKDSIQTPQGWIPKTTILDNQGRPIRETSTTGQTVDLTQQIQQPPLVSSQPGLGQFDLYDMDFYDQQADYGDDYLQPAIYNGYQGAPAIDQNGFQAVPAMGPLAAAFMPYIAKGVMWIGGLTIAYFAIRNLLPYIFKIAYKASSILTKQIAKALEKTGLLIPVLLGGAALAYYAATR